MAEHFQVVVRCKPSPEEKVWRIISNENRLEYTGGNSNETPSTSFCFTHIYDEAVTHCEFYEQAIAPKVTSLLDGNRSKLAVIAYGDASGGKSHTVFGTSGQTRVKDNARGVIYRCGQQLLAQLQQDSSTVYHMTVSFCHIFEDGRVADLFDTKKRNLDVVVNQSTLHYSVPDLTQQTVTSSRDVLRLIEKGYLMRNATGCVREPAKKISFSSAVKPLPLQQYRPHCTHAIFNFTVEYKLYESDQVHVVQANIVDLAGKSISEIHSSSPSSDGGMETMQKIMSTLPSQGIVATSSLFAKSSLTKILKPCFGGNCDTIIVANLSLNETNVARDCLRTLSDAQNIRNFSKKTAVSTAQSTLRQHLDQSEHINSERKMPLASVATGVSIQKSVKESIFTAVGDGTQTDFGNPPKTTGRFVSMVRPQANKPQPLSLLNEQGATSSSLKTSLPKMTQVDNTRKTEHRIQQPPPSPLFVSAHAHKRADSLPKSEESREEVDESSDDSLSLGSDDSDDQAPPTVSSGPPPPPLRGIPHFNPNSPLSSQLTSLPLIPSSANRPTSALKATTSKTSFVSCNLSSNSAESQRGPASVQNTVEVESVSSGDSRIIETDTGTKKQPNNQTQQVLIDPQVKAKRTLFPNEATTSSSRDPQNNAETSNAMDTNIKFSGPNETNSVSLTTHVGPPLNKTFLLAGPSSKPSLPKITQVIPSLPRTHLPVKQQTTTEEPSVSPVPIDISSTSQGISEVRVNSSAENNTELRQIQERSLPLESLQHKEVQRNRLVVQRRRRIDEGSESDGSDTSSSLTISSDSEEELNDEARDHFNPNMQRRVLQMQPASRGHYARQLPILPPISPPSHGTPPHVIPNQPRPLTHLTPIEHPPSYSERDSGGPSTPISSSRHIPLPVYNSPSRGSSSASSSEQSPRRSDGVLPEGRDVDLSQYMSNDEIHVAAMEGIRGSEMKRLAIQFGVDHRDRGGRTPLMYAVLGNQPKMCEVLIKLKASIDAKDLCGLTPLLWATNLARAEVMRVLLKNKVGVHCTDADGRSAYHWAMKTPNLQCLKWLCKYANFPTLLNKPDNEGLTPLHWAVMSDQASHILLFLTSTSADVSVTDREGRMPLNYAVLNFSPACIRAILDCRENAVNLIDIKGRTALHYACAEGSADCVRTLLSFRSCDLHCTDNNGTTPLHWAAAANQPGLVQLLLRRGADRGQRDNNDMTPLDHAQQRGHNDCIKILQTYGLRRPGSALSIVSRVSLPTHSGDTPTLDEQGHVVLRRPNRRFSLSGVSVSSMDRLPADGQAGSEERREEERGAGPASSLHPEGESVIGQTVSVAEDQRQTSSSTPSCTQLQPSPQTETNRRSRWLTLLCCSTRRTNVVVPMS